MTKEELREKRNRTIESLNDIKAMLGLDELYIDELKDEIRTWRKASEDNSYKAFQLQEENKSLTNIKNIYIGDLLKAKKILKKFLDAKNIEETCVAESEAEQFLKENK